MNNKITLLLITVFTIGLASCKKNTGTGGGGGGGGGNPPPTSVLKDAASYQVGVGINYDLMKNNSSYSTLVKTHFDRVTAEYQMKHGAVVKNDGSFDFAKTDDLLTNLTTGLAVFGHTLAWHANNNGSYL